jgi:hypothetical protein
MAGLAIVTVVSSGIGRRTQSGWLPMGGTYSSSLDASSASVSSRIA